MTMYYIKKCVLLFIFSFALGSAQEDPIVFWQPQISLNYKVSPDYSHNFSLTQRNYMFRDQDVEFSVRQLDIAHFSRLKIKDNQSIGLGVQYRFRTWFEPGRSNELRLTQQYNRTHGPGTLRFGHRLRVEQRIFTARTVHRMRYRFALDFPLAGEKLDVGEPYFVGTLESLLSVTRGNHPQYDQRLTINIGWLLGKRSKLQTGLEYRLEDFTQETENVIFLLSSLILTL